MDEKEHIERITKERMNTQLPEPFDMEQAERAGIFFYRIRQNGSGKWEAGHYDRQMQWVVKSLHDSPEQAESNAGFYNSLSRKFYEGGQNEKALAKMRRKMK